MITVMTPNPQGLITSINASINANRIRTWSRRDTGHYTHAHTDWDGQAFLLPVIYADQVRFKIVRETNTPLTRNLYGIYHGRFIEMLVRHFPLRITAIGCTPNPVDNFDSPIEMEDVTP
jgi:hypothetical protein